MSLFAFGVIVNTKRLQILKMTHLEGDICIENEVINLFLLLWWVVPQLAARYTPCLPKLSSTWGGIKTEKLLSWDKGSLMKVKGVHATRRGIYLLLPSNNQMSSCFLASRASAPVMTNWEDKCHNKPCPSILLFSLRFYGCSQLFGEPGSAVSPGSQFEGSRVFGEKAWHCKSCSATAEHWGGVTGDFTNHKCKAQHYMGHQEEN